jgi:tetratricopeptide (TPR) repeat protein
MPAVNPNRPLSPQVTPNRPSPQANPNRPSLVAMPDYRPGQGPDRGRPDGNRPDRVRPDRPPVDVVRPDRPPAGNRPQHDLSQYYRRPDYRPDVVINRPDININRPVINRPININNTTINNFNPQFNNNAQVNNVRTARPYYPHLHHHWQPSNWSAAYRPAYYNYGYANTTGSALSFGGVSAGFVNPFFVRPVTQAATQVVRYDYSQPIRVPDPDYRETEDELVRSERAVHRFDDAREVFRRGEYGRASELVDEAIELLPSDPTLHQFRALVLFARQRFQDSAAALYSVLAVSPGWDRQTLLKLYDTPERYLGQVAELERALAANPQSLDGRFLLAYHYLMKGDLAGAQRQLEVVRAAKPTDQVVLNLLSALGQQPAA